jgi:diguanylate cyclase (GGDEF)-like protein/PAS domain S-box-containing protein
MTPAPPPNPETPEGAPTLALGLGRQVLDRQVLDHMSDLVALLDSEGKRLYNSPSYDAVFGDKELAGTDSFRDIHPEDRERVQRVFRKTVASGVGQRTQYRFLLADGSIRHIESQGDVIKDAGGKVVQVVVVARDVTRRRESERALEDANRQLRATVLELERRNRENVVLGKLGDMLEMCKSAEESRGVLEQYVDKLFPGTSGNLYLLNPGNDLLEAVVTWGEAGPAGDPVIGKDDCWALRRGQLHVVEDAHSKLTCQHLIAPPSGAYLCAPIMGQGELLGMLHVQFGAAQFGDHHASEPAPVRQRQLQSQQAWALTVTEHIALALANLKLRETLRAQAVHDSLTGLFNRRYLEQALEREVLRATRNGRTVGVIMLDLDHLKRFNDAHGHEAGDMLLRVLGDFLVTHVRAEDIACRYGGEEFVVILPEASLAMSRSRAEELWKGVQGLSVNFHGELLRGVTASVGVAAFPAHGATMAELLRAADAALYAAKREGRDRVQIAAQKS